MHRLTRALAVFVTTLLLSGCPLLDEDNNTSTSTSTSATVARISTTVGSAPANSIWALSLFDNTEVDYRLILLNGQAFAIANDLSSYLVGTASVDNSNIILSLANETVSYSDLELAPLNVFEAGTYSGVLDSLNQTGAVTVSAFASVNSGNTLIINDSWSSGSDVFTTNGLGNFIALESTTGCDINATISYDVNGIYTLEGTASSCDDSTNNGSMLGYGQVVTYNAFTNQKTFDALLVFGGSTPTYVVFSMSTT